MLLTGLLKSFLVSWMRLGDWSLEEFDTVKKGSFSFSLVLQIFADQPLTYKIVSTRANLILLKESLDPLHITPEKFEKAALFLLDSTVRLTVHTNPSKVVHTAGAYSGFLAWSDQENS